MSARVRRYLGAAILLLLAARPAAAFQYPSDWYWITVENPTHAFSSAGPGYVILTDAGYLAWVAAGNVATTTLHDGQLASILGGTGLGAATLAVNPTVWTGVAPGNALAAVATAGCALTYTAVSALDATYELTGNSFNYLTSDIWKFAKDAAAFPNSWSTITYQARSGAVTLDTVAHTLAVVDGLLAYRAAWENWSQNGGSAPTWGACATS